VDVLSVAEGTDTDDGGAEGEGGESEDGCIDREGIRVAEGAVYKPDEDPCIECICREGRQTQCMSVACQPPSCEWERIEGECCQFRCLDDSDNNDIIAPSQCIYTTYILIVLVHTTANEIFIIIIIVVVVIFKRKFTV